MPPFFEAASSRLATPGPLGPKFSRTLIVSVHKVCKDPISFSWSFWPVTDLIIAKVIAVISFVSAVAGLIDIGCKVAYRLNEFNSTAREIPEVFKHTAAQLPVVLDALRRTEKRARAGLVDKQIPNALIPSLAGCHERIAALYSILEEVLPKENDSSLREALEATRSLSKDKEIQVALKDIDRCLINLTFHNTSGGTMPVGSANVSNPIDMTPAGRDPNFADRLDLFNPLALAIK